MRPFTLNGQSQTDRAAQLYKGGTRKGEMKKKKLENKNETKHKIIRLKKKQNEHLALFPRC